MSEYYVLVNRKAVPATQRQWAEFFGDMKNRRVALDEINGARVSTVFLGSNHQFGEGPPLIFETLISGGYHSDHQTRCSTWEEAEEMHRVACILAAAGPEP